MARRSSQRSLFDDDPGLTEDSDVATAGASDTTPREAPSPDLADLEGKSVYVVDAHSLIYQVFHALPEISSPRGEPVGAVFGFARDLVFLPTTSRVTRVPGQYSTTGEPTSSPRASRGA